MSHAAKTAFAGPAPTAPATRASDDGRLKLQAFAATPGAFSEPGKAPGSFAEAGPCANWELRPLGALGFELASARG